MLLLDVEAEIASEHEAAFHEWYYPHVPHLMTAPGYESGRRYVRTSGAGSKYVALYELDGEDCLPSLLGDDLSRRHPASVADWQDWDERLVPYMTHSAIKVYTAAAGTARFLRGNHPVALIRIAGGGGSSSWEAVVNRLGKSCEVVSAVRLDLHDHPSTRWLNSEPDQLVLVELLGSDGLSALPSLREALDGAPGHQLTTYRQIAWHVPFRRV